MGAPGQIAELFSPRATIQRWLRFEIALARVEADHGIIPRAAADAIAAVSIEDLDLAEIAQGAQRTRHAVVPFVRALSRAAGPHGEFVHWGSTSQDVMDVGKTLAIRDADALMDAALVRLLTALAELADRHRRTLMPGRTAGQFATPITFGGKVAGWADEVLREMRAFDGVRSVVLTGQLGGTTGQHAVFGAQGAVVRDEVCAALGLTAPLVTWHTSRDRFVRWAFHCAMIAGALGRIAAEIMNLQRSEIAELAEPFDSLQVGSSAMPHKRNPTITATLMASVTMVEAEFTAALSTWRGLHERDKSQFGVEDEYLPSITTRTLDQIPQLTHVVEHLGVDVDAMSRDLDRDGRTVWSEMLLYHVAQTHGRATAHELIRNASDAWRPGRDLPQILAADPAIAPAVIPETLPDKETVDLILAAGGTIVDRVVAEIRDYVKGKQ
jgi:3-carboxy-cis,cis-muconate cycloisomerase